MIAISGGKKKYPKKRMYSEGEVRRAIKQATDEAVTRIMLMCIVAARDEFDMDEDGVVKFVETMKRYIQYFDNGTLSIKAFSESLKKNTGIDLRLTRW